MSRSAHVEAHDGVTRTLIRCAAASLLLLIGCGPERLILSASESDAAVDAAVDADWTDGSLVDAWYMPCYQDDWECELGWVCEYERCVPCSELPNECVAPCPFGEPVPWVRNGCAVCECPVMSCYIHADCPYEMLCAGGICQSCPEAGDNCGAPCFDGSSRIATVRNGCPVCECAPPSQCWSDEDCGGPPMRCYPGSQCDDGCAGDPTCCSGNICALEGCDETYYLTCGAVGCPDGLMCVTSCPSPQCMCDPGATGWTCEPDCGDAMCVPAM